MKKQRVTVSQLRAEIEMLQQVIGALTSRAGGFVDLSAEELNAIEGDGTVMTVTAEGCQVRVERNIRVVSSLN